jgi:hypothetical protein
MRTKENARTAVQRRIGGIKASLERIEKELQRYRQLTDPDWGQVGDLAFVDDLLTRAVEFIIGAK